MPKSRTTGIKQRDRLPAADHRALNQPVTDAILNFRAGTASAADQATLAAAFSVAYRVAERVPRHRHLLSELKPALSALTAAYERYAGEPTDTPWVITVAETDHLHFAARVYAAVLLATSCVHVRRAIDAVVRNS